jgi:DNA-binding transcriptional regulator YhcF (GntR family)
VALRVDPRSDVPPSRQIVEAFLDRLASGALVAGDRLPSVRALAEEALVNPNTVGKAYRDLEAAGAVEGRNGSGVFVTEEGPARARALRRTETLAAFRRAAREALRAGHAAEALRAALARAEGNGAEAPRGAREDVA